MREIEVTIRKFERYDIPRKVEWINNSQNNEFLHYDIPLDISRTNRWFDYHIGDKTRFDAIIEADGMPVGLIGLLSIDEKNKKAEFYIAMGEGSYKGKGVAKKASKLVIEYGFDVLNLNRIYLFTEVENKLAQYLFESVGFIREGILRSNLISHDEFVDCIVYGYLREDWTK